LNLIAKEGDLKITTTKSPTITNTNKLVLGSSKNYISNLYMDAHCKVSPLSVGRPRRAINSNASTQTQIPFKI
jgi:hypothetical protein